MAKESAEESKEIHQALEIKRPTSCQVRQLNGKSQVSIQDSIFVVEKLFDQERVKKSFSK